MSASQPRRANTLQQRAGCQLELWHQLPRALNREHRARAKGELEYFLGVHRPGWLALSEQSLFISHRVLRARRTFPRARARWALDSGGFTELNMYGEWRTTPREYAAHVRRYVDEIGGLVFASQQDLMCEPSVLAKTKLSVRIHQERTIDNFLELMSIAPDLPWMPVVQGWTVGDYRDHVRMWKARRVDLTEFARVGVGTVCRRSCPIALKRILSDLATEGFRIHAFGLKISGLHSAGGHLVSADSMAWSYAARRQNRDMGWRLAGRRTGAQNRLATARDWFEENIQPILRAGFCAQTGFSRRFLKDAARKTDRRVRRPSGRNARAEYDQNNTPPWLGRAESDAAANEHAA